MTLRIPSIPVPTAPLMDPNNPALWNTVWYDYFRALDQAAREAQGNVTSLQNAVAVLQLGNPVAFASLPASPAVGRMAIVNNSSTQVWGANANGSGALTAFVIWNGTNWTVFGK